jgi:hypothetical protein
MIKKIYFFISSPLDNRDTDRFGLEVLQRNGFDVEVWDFTEIINPERFKSYTPPDEGNFNKCRLFSRKEEALFEIKKLPTGTFVVCLLSYEYRSHVIFRALSKYRIPYGLYIYNYPSFNIKKKSIIRRLLNITPSKLATHLFNNAPLKYLGIRPASIVLALGGEFFVQKFSICKETKILWSHNFDYEIYLRVMNQSFKQDNKMGVFLDQYLPFHPDAIASPIFAAEEYYPRLCRFFDHLEKNYDVHIVIAAHPRSQYETQESLYGNRTIMRGRTAELVKESGFVILHDSASINYAVLFKKPMIFITTDRMEQASAGVHFTDFMALMFDKKPLNIDQSYEIDLNRELIVNERFYEEYKNKYIKKSGTDDTPAWQVFADCLKKQIAIGFQ